MENRTTMMCHFWSPAVRQVALGERRALAAERLPAHSSLTHEWFYFKLMWSV